MRKNRTISTYFTHNEVIGGWIYFAFELLALPWILRTVNGFLPRHLSESELNFTFYLINFLSILWIFHDYLGRNMSHVKNHPAYFCQALVLGLAAYWSCNWLMGQVITHIDPAFVNPNDAAISGMTSSNFFLMAVGTIVLVPPVEECLFRGLIFRGLYGKSRILAYAVSIAAFAAVHITGYIGAYSIWELLLSFLQYLPAGLCLAWAYAKSDTIFAPIIIHAAINAIGIFNLR